MSKKANKIMAAIDKLKENKLDDTNKCSLLQYVANNLEALNQNENLSFSMYDKLAAIMCRNLRNEPVNPSNQIMLAEAQILSYLMIYLKNGTMQHVPYSHFVSYFKWFIRSYSSELLSLSELEHPEIIKLKKHREFMKNAISNRFDLAHKLDRSLKSNFRFFIELYSLGNTISKKRFPQDFEPNLSRTRNLLLSLFQFPQFIIELALEPFNTYEDDFDPDELWEAQDEDSFRMAANFFEKIILTIPVSFYIFAPLLALFYIIVCLVCIAMSLVINTSLITVNLFQRLFLSISNILSTSENINSETSIEYTHFLYLHIIKHLISTLVLSPIILLCSSVLAVYVPSCWLIACLSQSICETHRMRKAEELNTRQIEDLNIKGADISEEFAQSVVAHYESRFIKRYSKLSIVLSLCILFGHQSQSSRILIGLLKSKYRPIDEKSQMLKGYMSYNSNRGKSLFASIAHVAKTYNFPAEDVKHAPS